MPELIERDEARDYLEFVLAIYRAEYPGIEDAEIYKHMLAELRHDSPATAAMAETMVWHVV